MASELHLWSRRECDFLSYSDILITTLWLPKPSIRRPKITGEQEAANAIALSCKSQFKRTCQLLGQEKNSTSKRCMFSDTFKNSITLAKNVNQQMVLLRAVCSQPHILYLPYYVSLINSFHWNHRQGPETEARSQWTPHITFSSWQTKQKEKSGRIELMWTVLIINYI